MTVANIQIECDGWVNDDLACDNVIDLPAYTADEARRGAGLERWSSVLVAHGEWRDFCPDHREQAHNENLAWPTEKAWDNASSTAWHGW